jgi:hypothetical protein
LFAGGIGKNSKKLPVETVSVEYERRQFLASHLKIKKDLPCFLQTLLNIFLTNMIG